MEFIIEEWELDLKENELAFTMNGKIYIFNEPFYKIYESGKKLVEIIDQLEEGGHSYELELARGFQEAYKRLEDKYPHYLERYLIEKGEEKELEGLDERRDD